jgi:hypothetical protein
VTSEPRALWTKWAGADVREPVRHTEVLGAAGSGSRPWIVGAGPYSPATASVAAVNLPLWAAGARTAKPGGAGAAGVEA